MMNTRLMETIPVGTRVLQMLFCVICLACSAHQISLYSGWYSLQPINFALFASITGLMVSGLLLAGPRFSPVLAERLPGLVDVVLSGLWSIFFLAVGGSVASFGTCSSYSYYRDYTYYSPYFWGHRRLLAAPTAGPVGGDRQLLAVNSACGTWNAVIAMGFLCFVVYGVSAVFAGLDIRAGKGLVKPRGFMASDAVAGGVTMATAAKPAAPITN